MLHPCWVFRTAISIEVNDMFEAIERSKSPVVSGRISPSDSMSRTAWDPKIVWKFPLVG